MYLQYRAFATILAAMVLCVFSTRGHSDSISVKLDPPGGAIVASQGTVTANASRRQPIERIDLDGYSSYVASGNPALPCRLIYVALPPNADVSTLKIIPGSYSTTIVPGAYDVAPVPSIAPADGSATKNDAATAKRNPEVYDKNGFYPSEHVVVRDVGWLRTWRVVALEYWPYCYNPASGKLRRVGSSAAALTYSTDQSAPAAPPDPAAPDMAGILANREQAAQWYNSNAQPTASNHGYAIITTKAIASASAKLTDFADLLALRGFSVRIVTEDIWGGGTGDKAANNLRRWLAGHYIDLGIEYVLMIGNPDPASGDVPMKMLWPRYDQSAYREAPSDYYYSDLTGNWDRNGDGYSGAYPQDFGPGGIDRIPDVYVGRMPFYGNMADLDHILQKTIDYESSAPSEWRRRFLLPMKVLDAYTPSYQFGENIRNKVALPLGLGCTRVYDSDFRLNPAPEIYPCDYDPVQAEWRKGMGFVFWMTHGGEDFASHVLTAGQCESLNDSQPSITYQASCSNGTPENPGNLGYSLLRRGAVCTLSASRASWYYIAENDFTSSDSIGGLGYQYAHYLIQKGESCGRAAMDSRLSVPMYIWPNQLVFNLYGDPSLTFNQVSPGAVSGYVSTINDLPVPGATIALSDGTRSCQSQPDGSYFLGGLASEQKDLTISAGGYYPQRFYGVPVASGKTTRLDMRLADAPRGSVAGHVYDIFGSPVSEAEVEADGNGLGTLTQNDGSYALDDLAPGQYSLVASKAPFAQEMVADCRVDEGRSTEIDIVLRGRTGNAIVNGSFETGFGDAVASSWSSYSSPDFPGSLLCGSDFHRYGSGSQRIYLAPATGLEYAGVFQQVDVIPGRQYSLIAWERERFGSTDIAPRSETAGRLGFDPTGGSDPSSATVVWQDFGIAQDAWRGQVREVTPYAQTMTVFLEARRKGPADDCWVWFDGVSLMGTVKAPSVPTVSVSSLYQTETSSVAASWSCPDTDVMSYDYAVSATADDSGIVPGGDWVNVGTATSAVRTKLRLAGSQAVRVLVRAKNSAGIASEIGVSPPVRIVQDATDVPSAKQMADGAWVRISGVRLSRMGEGPECFVQDKSRVFGIKVQGDWSKIPYLRPGTDMSVVGRLSTQDSMRVLTDAELMPSVMTEAVRPIGMSNRSVGSTNAGALAAVFGRVKEASSVSFVIDDGSLKGGLTVRCFNSVPCPEVGMWVRVTGISTGEGVCVYEAGDVEVYGP